MGFSNQMYYAFGRPAWGVALAFLTFSMYLLHLLVLAWWAQDLDFPAYYSVWNEFLLVIGIWFIVATISTVLWFVMEKPTSNLVTLFLKALMGGGQKKKLY